MANIEMNDVDITVGFSTATSRSNITSGESIKTMMGKISKYISDTKTVAYSGSYTDLSNTPVSSGTGSNANDLYINNNTGVVHVGSGGLDVSGSVTATAFNGNATSATSATSATNDSNGQEISSTYIKSLSATGNTITYTKGDGTTGTITSGSENITYDVMTGATSSSTGTSGLVPAPAAGKQTSFLRGDGTWVIPTDTTYGVATTSTSGLMSSSDKTKLDGIAAGANNYVHPTTSGYMHIPSGGEDGQMLLCTGDGTAAWADYIVHVYNNATTISDGLMSSADKTKLSQIENRATRVIVDSSLDYSSTNAIQNKVVCDALDTKADSDHTHEYIVSPYYYSGNNRKADANDVSEYLTTLQKSSLSLMVATSSMTSNKPMGDGYILTFGWDTTAGFGAQLFITNGVSANGLQYRGGSGSNGSTTWSEWYTLLSNKNLSSYIDNDTIKLSDSQLYGVGHLREGYSYSAKTINSNSIASSTGGTGAEVFNNSANYAIGNYSHAEGSSTATLGAYSHVEGYQNVIDNSASSGAHVEGYNNTITGSSRDSHAEGYNNKINAVADAHVEGNSCTVSGPQAHAEGYQTTASGNNSHAEGNGTKATNSSAHAEGNGGTASGARSHVEGGSCTASGTDSHAGGNGCTASGDRSFVHGNSNTCAGNNTVVGGYKNSLTSDATNTSVFGEENTVSGKDSIVGGYNNTVDAPYSIVEGWSNNLNSDSSSCLCGGHDNTVTAPYSIIYGGNNSSTCYGSMILGFNNSFTYAKSDRLQYNNIGSYVLGCSNSSEYTLNYVMGQCNTPANHRTYCFGTGLTTTNQYEIALGKANSSTVDSTIFSVGNGTWTTYNDSSTYTRSNAFEITKTEIDANLDFKVNSHSAYITDGSFILNRVNDTKGFQIQRNGVIISRITTGSANSYVGEKSYPFAYGYIKSIYGTISGTADYAEYMEWEDGNPEDDDRRGLLVSLSDSDDEYSESKMKLANKGDDIIGIISSDPIVIGDCYDDEWHDKYEHDIFGKIIQEEVTYPAQYNEDGTVKYEEWSRMVDKVSADWDETKEYVSRKDRSEWDMVGFLGKLVCIDDGTCKKNKYVTAVNGIATYSEEKTNIRMIKRIDDTHIRALIL